MLSVDGAKSLGRLITFVFPTPVYYTPACTFIDWKLIDKKNDVAIVVGFSLLNELVALLTIHGIVWMNLVDNWRLQTVHEGWNKENPKVA